MKIEYKPKFYKTGNAYYNIFVNLNGDKIIGSHGTNEEYKLRSKKLVSDLKKTTKRLSATLDSLSDSVTYFILHLSDSIVAFGDGSPEDVAKMQHIIWKFLRLFLPWKHNPDTNILITHTSATHHKSIEDFVKLTLKMRDARLLAMTPANMAYPANIAAHFKKIFENIPRARVSVINYAGLKKHGFNLILAIGESAINKPELFIVDRPAKGGAGKKICIIGKGITFDSGGLSIKGIRDMMDMKFDKIGACYGAYSLTYLMENPAYDNVHFIGIFPLAENAVSGRSVHPGDVIKSYLGKTVEITDPDAEGRLVLADAFGYAHKYKPDLIIDIATLTDHAELINCWHSGYYYAVPETLKIAVEKLSYDIGEPMLPMPSWDDHDDILESTVADFVNDPRDCSDAFTATLFMKQFIPPGAEWLHIDLSHEFDDHVPRGNGIRTIVTTVEWWLGHKKGGGGMVEASGSDEAEVSALHTASQGEESEESEADKNRRNELNELSMKKFEQVSKTVFFCLTDEDKIKYKPLLKKDKITVIINFENKSPHKRKRGNSNDAVQQELNAKVDALGPPLPENRNTRQKILLNIITTINNEITNNSRDSLEHFYPTTQDMVDIYNRTTRKHYNSLEIFNNLLEQGHDLSITSECIRSLFEQRLVCKYMKYINNSNIEREAKLFYKKDLDTLQEFYINLQQKQVAVNKKIITENKYCCYICGKTIEQNDRKEKDHIIPIGPAYVLGLNLCPINFTYVHKVCNENKKNNVPEGVIYFDEIATSILMSLQQFKAYSGGMLAMQRAAVNPQHSLRQIHRRLPKSSRVIVPNVKNSLINIADSLNNNLNEYIKTLKPTTNLNDIVERLYKISLISSVINILDAQSKVVKTGKNIIVGGGTFDEYLTNIIQDQCITTVPDCCWSLVDRAEFLKERYILCWGYTKIFFEKNKIVVNDVNATVDFIMKRIEFLIKTDKSVKLAIVETLAKLFGPKEEPIATDH